MRIDKCRMADALSFNYPFSILNYFVGFSFNSNLHTLQLFIIVSITGFNIQTKNNLKFEITEDSAKSKTRLKIKKANSFEFAFFYLKILRLRYADAVAVFIACCNKAGIPISSFCAVFSSCSKFSASRRTMSVCPIASAPATKPRYAAIS